MISFLFQHFLVFDSFFLDFWLLSLLKISSSSIAESSLLIWILIPGHSSVLSACFLDFIYYFFTLSPSLSPIWSWHSFCLNDLKRYTLKSKKKKKKLGAGNTLFLAVYKQLQWYLVVILGVMTLLSISLF